MVLKPVRPRPLFIILWNERCIIIFILIHLTDNKNNKNVALVYSVTICELKKERDCARPGSSQNNVVFDSPFMTSFL